MISPSSDDNDPISEAAARTRAVSRLLAYVMNGRVELDPVLIASLARLSARAAWWADRAVIEHGEAA